MSMWIVYCQNWFTTTKPNSETDNPPINPKFRASQSWSWKGIYFLHHRSYYLGLTLWLPTLGFSALEMGIHHALITSIDKPSQTQDVPYPTSPHTTLQHYSPYTILWKPPFYAPNFEKVGSIFTGVWLGHTKNEIMCVLRHWLGVCVFYFRFGKEGKVER